MNLLSLEEITRKELDKIKKPAMQVTFESAVKKIEADAESHLGGKPYILKGEEWPTCPSCKEDMDFFLQLREMDPDKIVTLKTFYQCDCQIKDYTPFISIREYSNPDPQFIDNAIYENKEFDDYLKIKLDPSWSAPSWTFLQSYNKPLYDQILSTFENDDDQADAFYDEQRLFNDFLPEDPFTVLYGYPEFYSEPVHPIKCNCCNNYTRFYFQIDSMQKQNINWNDGTLYCYVCPTTKTYFFLVN